MQLKGRFINFHGARYKFRGLNLKILHFGSSHEGVIKWHIKDRVYKIKIEMKILG